MLYEVITAEIQRSRRTPDMLSLAHLPPKLTVRQCYLALLCGLLVACQTPSYNFV